MFDSYYKLLAAEQSLKDKEKIDDCKHIDILTDTGSKICAACGEEVEQCLNYDKEWKFYSDKTSKNPSRCCTRKIKDKTIYQDLENMDISNHIKDIANDIYLQVCKDDIHRGMSRKSIVFACIFYAYILDNTPQSHDKLIKLFHIKKKNALKGIKFIGYNAPKDSPIRKTYITPKLIILEYLKNFNISVEKVQDIISLYDKVKDKSNFLNRSKPQSVASGVIWFWIKQNKKPINVKDYSKKVGLSELTINKMAKEIQNIVERNNF